MSKEAQAMATYRLHAPALGAEFEAPSPEEAQRIASGMVREACKPYDRLTYWIVAELYDESGSLVRRWYEAIDPEPPACKPLIEEFAKASERDLEHAWNVYGRSEDGHLWAHPRPVDDFCLRCGAVKYRLVEVSDPLSGEGLSGVEYSFAWAAPEVVDRYHRALAYLRARKSKADPKGGAPKS